MKPCCDDLYSYWKSRSSKLLLFCSTIHFSFPWVCLKTLVYCPYFPLPLTPVGTNRQLHTKSESPHRVRFLTLIGRWNSSCVSSQCLSSPRRPRWVSSSPKSSFPADFVKHFPLAVILFKWSLVGTKGSKVSQEKFAHTITPTPTAWTADTKHWIHWIGLNISLPQIWSYHPNFTEIRNQYSTDQALFFQSSLSNFGESVWIVGQSFLFLPDRSSAQSDLLLLCTIFYKLWHVHSERCSSAYQDCNKWLIEL